MGLTALGLLWLAWRLGGTLFAVIALGIYVYQEESKPDGVELRIDESGISVEEN